jgi:hypothetical protein
MTLLGLKPCLHSENPTSKQHRATELTANAWKCNSNQNSNTWCRILIVGMAVLVGKIMHIGALLPATWGACMCVLA